MNIEPLLLGLSTGSYCIISCAPITLPMLFSRKSSRRSNFLSVTKFLLGRAIGYTLFGIIVGIAGYFISEFTTEDVHWKFTGISNILIGLIMIISGFFYYFPHSRLCKILFNGKRKLNDLLIIGVLTGLNVCPPFIAGASRVLNTGSIVYGLIFFLLFFIGTSLFFLPLYGVHLFKKHINKIKEVSRITMIILGFYYLILHGILVIILNIK